MSRYAHSKELMRGMVSYELSSSDCEELLPVDTLVLLPALKLKRLRSCLSHSCKTDGAMSNKPVSVRGDSLLSYLCTSKSSRAEGPFSLTKVVISSDRRSRIVRNWAAASGLHTARTNGWSELRNTITHNQCLNSLLISNVCHLLVQIHACLHKLDTNKM